MNVVRQTATVLQLEHFPMPWVIGLGAVQAVLVIGVFQALFQGAFGPVALMLAMLAAIGWIWLTKIFRRLQIVLDRDAGTLRISASTPLGEQGADYPLAELTRAEVQTRHDSNSSPEQHLVLVLGNAEPPRRLWPDPFKPDAAELLNASARINAWLESGPAPQQDGAPAPGDPSP